MEAAQNNENPVAVVDNGAIVGQITRAAILAKLLDPRG